MQLEDEMKSEQQFEPLELYDLKLPSIPQRSRLYSLEPIGIGTSLVESLTSYIARLAENHCLFPKDLISQALLSISLKKYKSTNLFSLRNFTGSFNGIGIVASDLVQLLQLLTSRNELTLLTFLSCSSVLPQRKLIRQYQAWCPQCYENWKSKGQIIYQPLLWSTEVVKLCLRHNQVLISQCPYCYQKVPLLSSYSRVGYCSNCFQWLGFSSDSQFFNSSMLSNEETVEQEWVITNLGQLLAISPNLFQQQSTLSVAQALSHCTSQITQGNIAEFARLLDVPKNKLWMWQTGKVLPQISELLNVCYLLNLPLVDFLTLNTSKVTFQVVASHSKKKQTSHSTSKPRAKLDTKQIQEKLLSVLTNHEDLSLPMTEVAKQIGYDKRVIHRHFPELCRAISAKYLDYKQKKRQQQIRKSCEQVCQTAKILQTQGIYPSEGRVSELLEHPGVFRDPQVRFALKAIQKGLN
jgi:hypothetical protein